MKPALVLVVVLLAACGDVSSAMMDADAGGAGTTGAAGTGSSGAAGTGGGCDLGSERCGCYGNGTCDGALVCLSDVCVSSGAGGMAGGAGGGGGSSAGRGGTTGTGNTTGQGGGGGAACAAPNLMCSDGACVPPIGNGTVLHCGGCNACPSGATACNNGICGCSAAGQKLCGSFCVDTNTSTTHCGDCNRPCASGTCMNGVCVRPDGGA